MKNPKIKKWKIIACTFCNRKFYSPHGLNTHISKKHPSEKYKIVIKPRVSRSGRYSIKLTRKLQS